MYLVVPAIKSVISKVFNWFNKTDMVTPDKLEVSSTTYFVQSQASVPDLSVPDLSVPEMSVPEMSVPELSDGPKVKKKKLIRMRVVKRKKEVNNGL